MTLKHCSESQQESNCYSDIFILKCVYMHFTPSWNGWPRGLSFSLNFAFTTKYIKLPRISNIILIVPVNILSSASYILESEPISEYSSFLNDLVLNRLLPLERDEKFSVPSTPEKIRPRADLARFETYKKHMNDHRVKKRPCILYLPSSACRTSSKCSPVRIVFNSTQTHMNSCPDISEKCSSKFIWSSWHHIVTDAFVGIYNNTAHQTFTVNPVQSPKWQDLVALKYVEKALGLVK